MIEVPANRRIEDLAPKVQDLAFGVLADMRAAGFKAIQFDTLRTGDRQSSLFGKGRTAEELVAAGVDPKWAWPMCPDGKVTKASRLTLTVHAYGLAFDIVENDASPWTATSAFWRTLGESAEKRGGKWGGRWQFVDVPHVQWGSVPPTPTKQMQAMLAAGTPLRDIWALFGAL